MYRPKAQASAKDIAAEIREKWDAETGSPRVLQLKLQLAITKAITTDRQQTRDIALADAAQAMCELCRDGVKVIMLDSQLSRQVFHDSDGEWLECDAAPIQAMIFGELIARQEAAHV